MRSVLDNGHNAGVLGRVAKEIIEESRVVIVVASTFAVLVAITDHVHGIIVRVVLGIMVDRGVVVIWCIVRIGIGIRIMPCCSCCDSKSASREEVWSDAGRRSTTGSIGSCRATGVVAAASIGSGCS
jgi:hypothetical protein